MGTKGSHHFQSPGSLPNFFPEDVAINVESKSKAAIFLLFFRSSSVSAIFSGSKRATSRVGREPSLGGRSLHTVRSFGFWDVGVKKLATAPLEIVLCVLRFTGGGEISRSSPAFRLLELGDGGLILLLFLLLLYVENNDLKFKVLRRR